MAKIVKELEGMWEDIASHGTEFAGQTVRLQVLVPDEEPFPEVAANERLSTAASLLKYAGAWEGDDREECLRKVYETRSRFIID